MHAEWYPWYPALYRADTMHLTAEQDGIYRRLIDHYMETRQPLPDNDHALARIAGVDVECFKHASSIVRAFFKQSKEGFLHHKRCDLELDAQDRRSNTRSIIAKNAAEKRWMKQQDKCIEHASSMPDAMLGDATRQDKTIKTPIVPFADFDVFWKAYPLKKSKGQAEKAFKSAIKIASLEQLLAGIERYKKTREVRDGFIKHAGTWLNGRCWEDEAPEESKPLPIHGGLEFAPRDRSKPWSPFGGDG